VRKRDGRVIPFDPDAISQDLFTAAESLGTADPFLTRELTDGVLHFLAADNADAILTTDAVAELVVKVVRELRQPRLAEAFAERPRPAPLAVPQPAELVRQALTTFSLDHVYGRDLAAAHRAGLLVLTGLDAPAQLAAITVTVADPALPLDYLAPLARARRLASGWAVLDNPPPSEAMARIIAGAGLPVRVQLNSTAAPAAAPLFAEVSEPQHADPGVLFDAAAVDWHLADADFSGPADRLLRPIRHALDGRDVAFVFDRPKRPPSLGPGLDRQHPAVLLVAGMHLPALARHADADGDVELFLRKLGSLARLAVSAAVQKRQYLRQHGDESLRRGLLLERATLLVAPLGLDAVVRTFTGTGIVEGKPALDLARRLVEHMQAALTDEGRRRLVDTVLDAPPVPTFDNEEAGLTTWDADAPAERQLSASGKLHAVASSGTAVVAFADRPAAERVAELLAYAWRQTEVARLQLGVRRPAAPALLPA
jgi:hypothetical protein